MLFICNVILGHFILKYVPKEPIQKNVRLEMDMMLF